MTAATHGLMYRPSWHTTDAACRDADPRLFDPTVATPTSRQYPNERAQREAAALRYCAGCPALRVCADEADTHRDGGVRGGSLRHHDANTGGYTADPLIPGAPSTRVALRLNVKPRHPKRVA